MKLDPRIRKELMRRAGKETCARQMWSAYLAFLERCPDLPDHAPGTGVHHILWRSEYPQYRARRWNLIRLSHADHTAASALMLGAEPHNVDLFYGFNIASRIIDRSWSPQHPEKVVSEYTDDNRSLKELAHQHGIHASTMWKFMKRRSVQTPRLSSFRPSTSEALRILHAYAEKASLAQIRREFHVGRDALQTFLTKRGVYIRDVGSAISRAKTKSLGQKLEQEIQRVYLSGRSGLWICSRYGISSCWLNSFLSRSGIRIRSRSEAARLRRANEATRGWSRRPT
jgi:transposase-like protein